MCCPVCVVRDLDMLNESTDAYMSTVFLCVSNKSQHAESILFYACVDSFEFGAKIMKPLHNPCYHL